MCVHSVRRPNNFEELLYGILHIYAPSRSGANIDFSEVATFKVTTNRETTKTTYFFLTFHFTHVVVVVRFTEKASCSIGYRESPAQLYSYTRTVTIYQRFLD